MREIMLSVLAAIITIVVAGVLVRYQNKRDREMEEVKQKLLQSLNDVADEIESLTGDTIDHPEIQDLEKRVELLNESLRPVQKRSFKERKRKHGKNKKYFTDD